MWAMPNSFSNSHIYLSLYQRSLVGYIQLSEYTSMHTLKGIFCIFMSQSLYYLVIQSSRYLLSYL